MRRTSRVRSAASRGEMLMWRTGIMFAPQRYGRKVKTPANSRGITVSAVNNSRYAENSNKALVNEHRSQLKIFNSRYKGKMSTAIRIESRVMPLTSDVDKDTQKVAKALSQVLGNTFILSLKTQNLHWNVYGPMFHTLHLMFEEQ